MFEYFIQYKIKNVHNPLGINNKRQSVRGGAVERKVEFEGVAFYTCVWAMPGQRLCPSFVLSPQLCPSL